VKIEPVHLPSATYRLQFNGQFRFADALQMVGYLNDLGIHDAYASPLFRARVGSSHGYDVIDHGTIDPALGSEDDFRSLAEELRGRGLGLVMDVVPNHMGIDDPHNHWWQDVLENGQSSVYAKFFDIDWYPPKQALQEKVLLPFLGDQYGRVLENRELRLVYEDQWFRMAYYESRFPLAPRSWLLILKCILEQVAGVLEADHADRMELESIITALEYLPARNEQDPQRIQQRYREREVVRRRIATLYESSPAIRAALHQTVEEFNGRQGDPRSLDKLEALLADQAYRLCHWRVATDEINYRRFFDINALAAIRVEDPEVFQAVHAMVFRFVEQGWVTGLRIDHPDGLLDPLQYFEKLQQAFREHDQKRLEGSARGEGAARAATAGGTAGQYPVATSSDTTLLEPPDEELGRSIYVAVEKILEAEETLPPQWPVCGTTGYEFLNLLNGVFVDRSGARQLQRIYVRLTGQTPSFAGVVYESKRTILGTSMSSELYVLAGQLERISEQHRWSRDFTRISLYRALREVIACFPVYRTYIRPTTEQVSYEDQRRILTAIRAAKRRNPSLSPSFFDFIAAVLLLQHPEGISDEDRRQRVQFVLEFQQVTGPVMAKGLEDTAFYRWYPLASLNEVGGEPATPGVSLEQFHRRNQQRAEAWPYSMLATGTHDTKRGEDMRARLNVLSEVPDAWEQAVQRWQSWNEPHRRELDGQPAPDANEEYLLYQTLVGTWPLEGLDPEGRRAYGDRIRAYMEKALKEAKVHTAWTNPDPEYDQAVAGFITKILDEEASRQFLDDLEAFARRIACAGWVNSLGQSLLKIAAPGVPDFYQGTELWDFNLVDPDNRRPVDFALRKQLLAELQSRAEKDLAGLASELSACHWDPRIKLLVIWRGLQLRRRRPDLFLRGRYVPLLAGGPRAEHICAFARQWENHWAVAVVPRLALEAWGGDGSASWWEGTSLPLPAEAPSRWRHVVTGNVWPASGADDRPWDLAALLGQFPVAMLEAES